MQITVHGEKSSKRKKKERMGETESLARGALGGLETGQARKDRGKVEKKFI